MPIYAALRYRDAAAAIEWLERAFGFQTTARHDGLDDTVAHAEQDYGSRDFSARDLEGNHWSFGTYVPQAAAASPDSA